MGLGNVTPCANDWLVWAEGAGSQIVSKTAKPLLDGAAVSPADRDVPHAHRFGDQASASNEGVGPHLLLALYACH